MATVDSDAPGRARECGRTRVRCEAGGASASGPAPPPVPTPAADHRLLRGYAFDPSLATQLETALVSEITYKVPWEELAARAHRRVPGSGGLRPAQRVLLRARGPGSRRPSWRRTASRPPRATRSSTSRWSTRRSMTTIDRFERALGRKALWADRYRTGRQRSIGGRVRAAAAHLSARAAHGQRVLQPGQGLPCCSATFRPPRTEPPASSPAAWSSPACRTTSWRTRPPTRCWTASTSTSWRRPTRTCWPSTRRSPTSSPCSSTSPFPRC